MDKVPSPFEQLIGEELSGVTFVRDYLQLQFNPPPIVNVMTPVSLDAGGYRVTTGEKAFANALLAQIGKVINQVLFRADEFLKLGFSDGSSLSISLKPEGYVG